MMISLPDGSSLAGGSSGFVVLLPGWLPGSTFLSTRELRTDMGVLYQTRDEAEAASWNLFYDGVPTVVRSTRGGYYVRLSRTEAELFDHRQKQLMLEAQRGRQRLGIG